MPTISRDQVAVKRYYIGIDPGGSGGLAVLYNDGSAEADPMPETERDICDWISRFILLPGYSTEQVFAVIEKVGGFVKGNPTPGSAMFKFGASYGGLRMALTASRIPYLEVAPQTWQKALSIPFKKGMDKTTKKNVLKQRAQQLFPNLKVTLATADALLIAWYCRMTTPVHVPK